jgi:ABC-type lipoprotein release transport system permease subunit
MSRPKANSACPKWLLFASVFLILLIACINVAGLLLARGSAREKEFSIRRAIGAGRLRIASQVIAETMTLSACGGVLGLLLAGFGCPAIRNFGTSDIPRLPDAHISWPVILFTAGITIFTALAASLWPALHRGRARLVSRQSVSPSTLPLAISSSQESSPWRSSSSFPRLC